MRRRVRIEFLGALVFGVLCSGGLAFFDVFSGLLSGSLGVVLGGLINIVLERRRGRQATASLRVAPSLASRSLWWVCGLLPGDEGTAWWAEVTSLLAEASNMSTRRRYVRSYRRKVPQLIWTSWTEHLRASRRRELS